MTGSEVCCCKGLRHRWSPQAAKQLGLWNLSLPSVSGLTNLRYAPLAEISGWSLQTAPEAINCAAPDTGNMVTLHRLATEEQSKQWLEPLVNSEIRSGFSMTERMRATFSAYQTRLSLEYNVLSRGTEIYPLSAI